MNTRTSSTKLKDHSERSHALLSASGAGRWLNCTPSARLEDEYGEKKSTVYAEEGTLAHELGELYLTRDALEAITEDEFSIRLEEIMSNDLFNEEMLDMVPVYTDYCIAQLAEAKTADKFATMEIEQKLDLTEYVPESFGTADCCILGGAILEIIDLKWGKGVPVYATWNKQLMLYGLGALSKYSILYSIHTVRLTIVQPRINNISTFEISVEELLDWANTELKPKAELAFAGQGQLEAGDWCRFCAVKNKCRKLYEQQIEIAKYEFAEPELLTDAEIADIITRTPKLVEWANSILAYAQDMAVNENKQWPGFKLVEGRSIRKWIDDEQAIEDALMEKGKLIEEEIFTQKLKSITDIERTVGKKKFAELFSNLVVKPQGKPTLVPIEDKRPALGIEDAINDFK